jgi:hypothetical protein
MRQTIIQNMGLDRIRARVPEWLAAMRAGRAAAPRCTAIKRDGHPCQRERMRGATKCEAHLQGAARDAVDLARLRRAQAALTSTNTKKRAEAERAIRVTKRRQTHRLWKLDPTYPGSTLELPANDERRVRGWLLHHHGIDLVFFRHGTGHHLSARAVDRLRYAGLMSLTNRMTADGGWRRVVVALRDDAAWWRKHPEA